MEEDPALPVGQEFEFKIIKLNEAQKRIGLSLRGKAEENERQRLSDYQRQAADATSSIGDVIRQQEPEEHEPGQ
jgi:small subunit ribosomal protein S1